MDNIFNGLSDKQIDFICEECGIGIEEFKDSTDDKAYEIYDIICDVEVEETIKFDDKELSERGQQAETIVTIIGNNIRLEEE